ncbi:MAG TPA: hypothetical protein VMX54_00305 [Vicinamibacteria bacterium]|nr:hypothetical protein [Vicinamibacteria bacterium]
MWATCAPAERAHPAHARDGVANHGCHCQMVGYLERPLVIVVMTNSEVAYSS